MPKSGLPCLLMQVAAAGVLALVIMVLVIKGAEMFYGEPEQTGRGYTVDVAGTPPATPMAASASAGAAAGAPPKEVDIMPYLAKADLALGEKIIKRCQVCHNFEKGGPNNVGPQPVWAGRPQSSDGSRF
jgi:cytochrome c